MRACACVYVFVLNESNVESVFARSQTFHAFVCVCIFVNASLCVCVCVCVCVSA